MEVTNRIKKYLDRIFADGRTEVSSADFPLENDDDYVDSMFLLSRYKETSSYEIEFSEGSVRHGKYSIPNFVIRKRETKKLELSGKEIYEFGFAVYAQIKTLEKLVESMNSYESDDITALQYKISILQSVYFRHKKNTDEIGLSEDEKREVCVAINTQMERLKRIAFYPGACSVDEMVKYVSRISVLNSVYTRLLQIV